MPSPEHSVSIDLGLVNEMGGNCIAIGSLTLDTGVGVDDLLAVFMSRGHVLVYAGTDPSNADTWQISGIFHLGTVIGDKPLVKLGGDLIAITSDGYIPLLQFLGAGTRAAPACHFGQDRSDRDRGCAASGCSGRMAGYPVQ